MKPIQLYDYQYLILHRIEEQLASHLDEFFVLQQAVEDFKQGRIDCLVNVNLFDEGFDCPDVEYIQMARPTLPFSKYLQMVGQGLRVHPDKKMCVTNSTLKFL